MTHHLDGNMIAADRHHGRGGDKQIGDRCQCGGFIEDMADEDSDDEQLACTECGATE